MPKKCDYTRSKACIDLFYAGFLRSPIQLTFLHQKSGDFHTITRNITKPKSISESWSSWFVAIIVELRVGQICGLFHHRHLWTGFCHVLSYGVLSIPLSRQQITSGENSLIDETVKQRCIIASQVVQMRRRDVRLDEVKQTPVEPRQSW